MGDAIALSGVVLITPELVPDMEMTDKFKNIDIGNIKEGDIVVVE